MREMTYGWAYQVTGQCLPNALAMAMLSRKLIKGATAIPIPISCIDIIQSNHHNMYI